MRHFTASQAHQSLLLKNETPPTLACCSNGQTQARWHPGTTSTIRKGIGKSSHTVFDPRQSSPMHRNSTVWEVSSLIPMFCKEKQARNRFYSHFGDTNLLFRNRHAFMWYWTHAESQTRGKHERNTYNLCMKRRKGLTNVVEWCQRPVIYEKVVLVIPKSRSLKVVLFYI